MRLMPLYLVVLLLGVVVPARAQIFQITVGGVITSSSGTFSGVASGTPFTFEETFNIANASPVSSEGTTSVTYVDPTSTSSFSFAGFSFSGTASEIVVTSGEPFGNPTDNLKLYGLSFAEPLAVDGYKIQLLSVSPSAAPSTSLSSLHAETFVEYDNSLNLAALNGNAGNFIAGHNTFFSVQVQSVPEPTSVALAVLAILVFGWRRSRAKA